MNTYAVFNTETKTYFAGFAKDGSVIWAGEKTAKRMTRLVAQGQASLLIANRYRVQNKPVHLGAA